MLIVITIVLFAFLKYTTTGKQIRAVSQNPIGAEVVGINTKRIYILTYGIGTALAGIAGALLTGFYTIFPTAGASFGFRALIVVVVGGLGSIPGAFFAGIFLGLLETMVALFISSSSSTLPSSDGQAASGFPSNGAILSWISALSARYPTITSGW